MSAPLPEPLDFGWPWRSLEATEHSNVTLGDGRIELRIWHDFLPGLTLDMLAWWFQNVDGAGTFQGTTLPFYRLWHPRDHIEVNGTRDESGRISAGCQIHIHEMFGRDPACHVDQTATLHRWDRGGVGLHVDKAGHRVMELDHVFRERKDGLLYETCMRVGAASGPLSGIIDHYVVQKRFGPHVTQAWLKHNVEEVGCFLQFLPEVYRTHAT